MQLARVRSLLATDPAKALAAAGEGDRAYPRGILRQEREAIAIEALVLLRRGDEAQRRAARFLHDYPNGPFSDRMQEVAR